MKTYAKVLLLIIVVILISLIVTSIFRSDIRKRWDIYNLTVDSSYVEVIIDDSLNTGTFKRYKEYFILNNVSSISGNTIINYLEKSNTIIRFSTNSNTKIDAKLYFIKNKELQNFDSNFINTLKNGEEVLAIIEYKSLFKLRYMLVEFSDEFIEILGSTDIK